MTCPRCERGNAVGRRFCGGCGASLELRCGACAFVNAADDHYCGGCGAAVGARRVVVASSGGAARLSSEEVHALLAELAPAGAAPKVELRDGAITQDDLDRLFGAAS